MTNRLSRRRALLIGVLAGLLIISYFVVTWPIQVQKIQMESSLPQNYTQTPVIGLLAPVAPNSTGNVDLTLQTFTFNSSDNTTQVSGTSGTLQATITPEGSNSRIDLNLQLNGVHFKSPSFTGSFSSLTLSGYVIVDPTTNKLIISLTASTSTLNIIRAFLGL